ncbi:alcohol dehydrogenase [Capronia epimyces CBS 606.96]|uniref:Alcohol dehydrogenase n=1 Tax=Capronia epimyces CBS 606.96 TaxID=1182542 RepID=W9XG08_9EURO|nr:alcohol dehydrogenase [Capronia epimyces CBS 606.96]EXJ79173.1 alcohol dehydrogenase [Capronia epimyces CBS 606.96]
MAASTSASGHPPPLLGRQDGTVGVGTSPQDSNPNPNPVFDTIPRECKAGVCVREGPDFQVRVEQVPVPEPGPDELLIRLNVTGICYSDIHFMQGDLDLPAMSTFGVRSPGHEGAGVVVKIGSKVQNWKVGDRAGLKPVWDTCGSCDLCWTGREAFCEKSIHAGLMKPGSYQQYVLSPARYTAPIPDGVDDYTAAPIMCSASTVHRSLVESRLRPGQWVAFPGGGGGVGIQGVQIAKAMGLRPIVIDTGKTKRELSLTCGAEHFVDFKESEDVVAQVIQLADGIGVHGVIVTAPNAYADAIAMVGKRISGKVMCIGLPPKGTVHLGCEPSKYCFQNLTISGTLVGSMHDIACALDFARRGLLSPIHTVYGIDQLPEVVEMLKNGQIAGRAVIDFNR